VGWASRRLEERGLEPILLPSRRTTLDFQYLRLLTRLVRRLRVDLVQTHLLGPAVYASLACAAGRRVPVVATFHGFLDVVKGRVWPAKRWLLRHGPARTVFVSDPLRDGFLAAGLVQPRRAVVIPNGIVVGSAADGGPRSLRAELGVQPHEVLVGAVGNVRRAKAYPVLLQVAARVHTACPRVRFVIVGDTDSPDYPELRRLQAALGLDEVVTFAGFRADVQDALRSLDIHVMTSSEEGFSLSTVEAMAAGLPVVATRCGGPEVIITPEHDGLLVERNAPDRIADAILRLVENPELRRSLGGAARQTAVSRFGLDRMLAAYEQVYRSCLGG
jgi:glycosyltransferase involved in cell wall biosynthesis